MASGGTWPIFSGAVGNGPPGVRANSKRPREQHASCISGAAPAAALPARRRASRLRLGPRPLRASLLLQHGPS